MAKIINTAMPIAAVDGIAVNGSLKCKTTNYTDNASRTIRKIVMHYTGNDSDSARGNANYFHNTTVEASAHYFVDEDSIYQSVDACDIAWHAGHKGTNIESIGIEMCCSSGYRVSAKTISNAVALCADWCHLIGITAADVDKYVLRHYDIIGKKCPAQMAGENNAEWNAFKAAVKHRLDNTIDAVPAPTKTETKTNNTEVCSVNLPILRKGDESGYVRTLQILLNKYNNAKLTEDGEFGNKTYNAVIAYQKDRKLDADGIVGAQTWAQLLK